MEEFYILKNIITQGLKAGYRKKSTNGEIGGLDMRNGSWVLSNGVELGSSWDVIMSKEFADIFWGNDASDNLQKMVVMDSSDRIGFIRNFVREDNVADVEAADETGDFYEAPADALMMTVRESLSNLKQYSIGLYKESCQDTYDKVKASVDKSSVTELQELDFIVLNSMNKVMDGALSKYLIENGKMSFTICPECGQKELIHVQGCSIDTRYRDWLVGRNIGC